MMEKSKEFDSFTLMISAKFKLCIGFRISKKILSLLVFEFAMGFPSCCTNVERTANVKFKIALYRGCRFPTLFFFCQAQSAPIIGHRISFLLHEVFSDGFVSLRVTKFRKF